MANERAVRMWVNALRSGDFKQGRTALRRSVSISSRHEHEYCCLGVACEVYRGLSDDGDDKWVGDTSDDNFWFQGNSAFMPQIVRQWLGIGRADWGDLEGQLIAMNDQHGKNFNQIADKIEAELL